MKSDTYVLHSDRIGLRGIRLLQISFTGFSDSSRRERFCYGELPAFERNVFICRVRIRAKICRIKHHVRLHVRVDECPVECVLIVQRDPRAPKCRNLQNVWVIILRFLYRPATLKSILYAESLCLSIYKFGISLKDETMRTSLPNVINFSEIFGHWVDWPKD